MTNEQREAIDTLKEITENDLLNYWEGTERPYNAIQIALSLIKEQQEEIEIYTTIYPEALIVIAEQEKQIDLMAELVYKRFKAELLLEYGFENEEQLKQYFERKVENEK